MKFTLITPTPPDISSFGIRIISAYLKEKGNDVQCIFLPGGIDNLKPDGSYIYKYDKSSLDDICGISKDSDIIGISFMTYYYDRGVQVADYLRSKLTIPVIFGGTHPTVSPEECLEHCDSVIIGEGEIPLESMTGKNGDLKSTPNLVFKGETGFVRNDIVPLITDLDSLPYFDFDLEGQFVLNHKTSKIEAMTEEKLCEHLPLMPSQSGNFNRTYRTMTTRGCPHECFYCVNKFLKTLYPGQKFLRRRSPENVIDELEKIKGKFNFVRGVQFFDDTFFASSTDYIEKFSNLYREKIGLPIYCQCSPATVTEKKLDSMLSAGLILLEMGIQTGSDREAQTFHRSESRNQLEKSLQSIHKKSKNMVRPHYHLILDSPWLDTNDLTATLDLLLKIPAPYKLCLASLTFFPGTELYKKAKKEGLIQDEFRQIYRKPFYRFNGNFMNFLIVLCGVEFMPRFIIRLLAGKFLVRLCHKRESSFFFTSSIALFEKLRVMYLGIKSLFSKDLEKISSHMKQIR